MDARYRIRPATSADLASLAGIERASFTDPWSVDGLAAHLRDLFLLLEADGDIAGYVIARAVGEQAEILNLAVAGSRRRQGVARTLLTEVCRRLVDGGATSVFLEVRPSNAAARAFYGGAGFREIGWRPNYYREPREDAVLLGKELARRADEA